ncbi:MAG: hypothetical protein NC928_00755 [Candidatus Omnitrophica bacterium]|nr:hypothetical protein [Candidatus Omnitrophota bacterium]
MNKAEIKNLKKRYCLWLYKTTKESLDKIERKFTQLEIDRGILSELKKSPHAKKIKKFIREFEGYIQNKERDGLNLKYKNNALRPEYEFLVLKLRAVKKIIAKELGKDALRKIGFLYEKEMAKRILKSTPHK